jgi:ABC-type Fe3+ transport system substrate-binding protein
VQSAADPPKKVQVGERAIMADGNDYVLELLKSHGQPVEVVYPVEGSPLIIVENGVFRSAPNPNAARLFQSFIFGVEAQQLLVDDFAHRSFHVLIKEKPGRKPLSDVKFQSRSCRRPRAGRGDQDALCQDIRRVGRKPDCCATWFFLRRCLRRQRLGRL